MRRLEEKLTLCQLGLERQVLYCATGTPLDSPVTTLASPTAAASPSNPLNPDVRLKVSSPVVWCTANILLVGSSPVQLWPLERRLQ